MRSRMAKVANDRFAWFEFHPDQFLGDDVVADMIDDHGPAAVGAYWLLCCRAWQKTPCGTLPKDDAKLRKLAGCKRYPELWEQIRDSVLSAFIPHGQDRIAHKRIMSEYTKCCDKSSERQRAGRMGAAARWGTEPDEDDDSDPIAMPCPARSLAINENSLAMAMPCKQTDRQTGYIDTQTKKTEQPSAENEAYSASEEEEEVELIKPVAVKPVREGTVILPPLSEKDQKGKATFEAAQNRAARQDGAREAKPVGTAIKPPAKRRKPRRIPEKQQIATREILKAIPGIGSKDRHDLATLGTSDEFRIALGYMPNPCANPGGWLRRAIEGEWYKPGKKGIK